MEIMTMENEALIRLVFGMRGCGKTVKVRNLIKDIRRLLVVDTKGYDYQDGVCFRSLANLKSFWHKVYRGDFRIIYKPQGDDSQTIEDIAQICTLCEACRNMTLVVEELNIIFDEQRPPTEFNRMIFSGREPGIELIGVAQRPFGFGRKLTSQAKEFYVFYNREPDDVKFFRQYLGSDAAEAIRGLERYHYLKWIYADGVQNWKIHKDEML
jgi:hypothetical protein